MLAVFVYYIYLIHLDLFKFSSAVNYHTTNTVLCEYEQNWKQRNITDCHICTIVYPRNFKLNVYKFIMNDYTVFPRN